MTRFLDSAGADQLWLFRPDGTGHMWWASTAEGIGLENDGEFSWMVQNDELVVEDFPPAAVTIDTPSRLFIHTVDDPSGRTGLLLLRCDLEVPEGVLGVDSTGHTMPRWEGVDVPLATGRLRAVSQEQQG